MSMDIGKMVYAIIGIVVAVIVVATVLIPTVDGLDITDTTQKTLIGVVVTLTILGVVMMAVRMIAWKN